MDEAYELQDIIDFLESGMIRLLFFSRPACGPCMAVKPKLEELLTDFPEAKAIYINLDRVPEASGHFSLYAIPGIILYANKKETVRLSRYFSMDDIKNPLTRYYNLLYS